MLSSRELFDIAIMTLAVGFIFMDFLRPGLRRHFDWKLLGFACLVTAPALIAHELAHKFVAIANGLQATFHAAYFWLGLGMLLKIIQSPFILFVPGYVSIQCTALPCNIAPLTSAIIAFAGPALNLILFITARTIIKQHYVKKRKWFVFWYITQRINLFLFIFNMLPLPLFDGFKVYAGLWKALF